jgi:hypothetical protein
VRIGVVEVNGQLSWNAATNPHIDMSRLTEDLTGACRGPDPHADAVVGVAHSQNPAAPGIAPRAQIRLGGSCFLASPQDAVVRLGDAADRAVAWGARVLNLSWGEEDQST